MLKSAEITAGERECPGKAMEISRTFPGNKMSTNGAGKRQCLISEEKRVQGETAARQRTPISSSFIFSFSGTKVSNNERPSDDSTNGDDGRVAKTNPEPTGSLCTYDDGT